MKDKIVARASSETRSKNNIHFSCVWGRRRKIEQERGESVRKRRKRGRGGKRGKRQEKLKNTSGKRGEKREGEGKRERRQNK